MLLSLVDRKCFCLALFVLSGQGLSPDQWSMLQSPFPLASVSKWYHGHHLQPAEKTSSSLQMLEAKSEACLLLFGFV